MKVEPKDGLSFFQEHFSVSIPLISSNFLTQIKTDPFFKNLEKDLSHIECERRSRELCSDILTFLRKGDYAQSFPLILLTRESKLFQAYFQHLCFHIHKQEQYALFLEVLKENLTRKTTPHLEKIENLQEVENIVKDISFIQKQVSSLAHIAIMQNISEGEALDMEVFFTKVLGSTCIESIPQDIWKEKNLYYVLNALSKHLRKKEKRYEYFLIEQCMEGASQRQRALQSFKKEYLQSLEKAFNAAFGKS